MEHPLSTLQKKVNLGKNGEIPARKFKHRIDTSVPALRVRRKHSGYNLYVGMTSTVGGRLTNFGGLRDKWPPTHHITPLSQRGERGESEHREICWSYRYRQCTLRVVALQLTLAAMNLIMITCGVPIVWRALSRSKSSIYQCVEQWLDAWEETYTTITDYTSVKRRLCSAVIKRKSGCSKCSAC